MSQEATAAQAMPVHPDLIYAYRPALASPVWEFRLSDAALAWEAGRRRGDVPFAQISRMRLSYRPTTMQSHRFMLEIWPEGGGRLKLLSVSWKSIAEQTRQDESYAAFVRALHRRTHAAAAGVRCERGVPAIQYWIGLILFAAVSLALAALFVRGVQAGSWAGAAFIAAFLALFLWQLGNFFKRNRPGRYTADALPEDLLPI